MDHLQVDVEVALRVLAGTNDELGKKAPTRARRPPPADKSSPFPLSPSSVLRRHCRPGHRCSRSPVPLTFAKLPDRQGEIMTFQ
jgi:hypothetical protein